MFTKVQYKEMLQHLKPRGRLLRDSPNFDKILEVYAEQLSLTDLQTEKLVSEMTPSLTNELIGNWEEVAGIDNSSLTLAERRELLVKKLSARLTLNKSVLKEILEAHGYVVTEIIEFRVFRLGDRVNNRLFSVDRALDFSVETVPSLYVVPFRLGDRVNNRLVEYDDLELVQLVEKHKPTHTRDFYNLGD